MASVSALDWSASDDVEDRVALKRLPPAARYAQFVHVRGSSCGRNPRYGSTTNFPNPSGSASLSRPLWTMKTPVVTLSARTPISLGTDAATSEREEGAMRTEARMDLDLDLDLDLDY